MEAEDKVEAGEGRSDADSGNTDGDSDDAAAGVATVGIAGARERHVLHSKSLTVLAASLPNFLTHSINSSCSIEFDPSTS